MVGNVIVTFLKKIVAKSFVSISLMHNNILWIFTWMKNRSSWTVIYNFLNSHIRRIFLLACQMFFRLMDNLISWYLLFSYILYIFFLFIFYCVLFSFFWGNYLKYFILKAKKNIALRKSLACKKLEEINEEINKNIFATHRH